MRQALLIFLFSNIFHFGFSQYLYDESRVKYDSLHKALIVAKADTTKITIWVELAQYHMFSRADSGIYYATRAISLARSIGYLNPELRALNALGLSYSTLGDYAKANRIDIEIAKIAEQRKDDRFRATAYRSLASNNRQFGNYKVALEFAKKSLSLVKIIGDDQSIALSALEVSRAFFALNQHDSAFWYAHRSREIADVKKITSLPYVQLGRLHRSLDNLDSALYYFKKSYARAGTSQTGRSNRALDIARTFMAQRQMDSSRFYAHHALQTAVDYRLYSHIVDANLFLSDFYEQEDPSRALKHSKMALTYSDSLSNMSRLSSFEAFKDYDEQQRQFELESAGREYQARIRNNTLLGITFTVLVIAFILYRNSKQKQKAKQKIELAYDQLKSTQSQLIQSEKMASLGELTAGIAHEIQNPLNFVNNFSEVNSELIEEQKEELENGNIPEAIKLANEIWDNEKKIVHHGKRADAIVKGMLQHSRTSSGQKELTDINALCDEFLRLSYHGLRTKDKSFNAKFETDFDASIPKLNVVPQDIGRVVLNLINNAFYAVSEKQTQAAQGYEPTIWVSTRRVDSPLGAGGSGGKIEIKVKDNGNGIPDSIKEKIFQPFFTTKPTGQGTGLGLSLSYDIVKAHGGEIKVNTKVDERNPDYYGKNEGTEFIIQIPIS